MSAETTLYSTLKGDAGVSGVVGAKIYARLAPEGTSAPFITYQLVVGTPYNKISAATGLEKKRIQVNCWANNYAAAKNLAGLVKTALNSTALLLLEIDDYVDDAQMDRVILDWSFIS